MGGMECRRYLGMISTGICRGILTRAVNSKDIRFQSTKERNANIRIGIPGNPG